MPVIKKLKYTLILSLAVTVLSLSLLAVPFFRYREGWASDGSMGEQLQYKKGSSDFGVFLLYDQSLSSSYISDLIRFLLENHIGVVVLKTQEFSEQQFSQAFRRSQDLLGLSAGKMFLFGVGKAGEKLAETTDFSKESAMGAVLVQIPDFTGTSADMAGKIQSHGSLPPILIIGDTDYADSLTDFYNLLSGDNILRAGGIFKAKSGSISLSVSSTAPLSSAVFSADFFDSLGGWLHTLTNMVFRIDYLPTFRGIGWAVSLSGLLISLLAAFLLAVKILGDDSEPIVLSFQNRQRPFISFRPVYWMISALAAVFLCTLAFLLYPAACSPGTGVLFYFLLASFISALLYKTGRMPGISEIPKRSENRWSFSGIRYAVITFSYILTAWFLFTISGFWNAEFSPFRLAVFAVLVPLFTFAFIEISDEFLVAEGFYIRGIKEILLVLARFLPLLLLSFFFVPLGQLSQFMSIIKYLFAIFVTVIAGRLFEKTTSSAIISAIFSSILLSTFFAFYAY